MRNRQQILTLLVFRKACLFLFLSLRINDGSLTYTDRNNQVSLSEVNLLAKSSDTGAYQIKVDSNLDIGRLQWQGLSTGEAESGQSYFDPVNGEW